MHTYFIAKKETAIPTNTENNERIQPRAKTTRIDTVATRNMHIHDTTTTETNKNKIQQTNNETTKTHN